MVRLRGNGKVRAVSFAGVDHFGVQGSSMLLTEA